MILIINTKNGFKKYRNKFIENQSKKVKKKTKIYKEL